MDLSRGFVTRVVDDDRANEAQRSGITSDFLDEDCIPVYNYIRRHYTEYKNAPSRDAVLKAFPNFTFADYKEPLEYFIDGLKESYRRNLLEDKLHDAAEVYHRDTQKAEAILREALQSLHVTQKSFQDVEIVSSALDRIELYEKRKTNPGADGILSGWKTLDYQTLGWHAEEFIVFVGEKYMGKSWGMIWMAIQAALKGERVLFNTKEMSQEAVTRRIDSIFASVPFDSLRRGELTYIEEQRYRERMKEIAESNMHITIARQGVNTIDDIESKAIETDATIVFGDSIYLYYPEANYRFTGETAKRLAVSQKCKKIAQSLGVPFIVSVQAGRNKTKDGVPDLDSIEWSNAFSQDADTVFFVNKDELDRELHRSHMWLLKSRDGDIADFYINQDFERMDFSERADDSQPRTQVFEDDDEGIVAEGV